MNDCLFNELQPICDDLCELIKFRVAIWMKAHSLGQGYGVDDFVYNIQQVRICL